jgi:hypothetical protein
MYNEYRNVFHHFYVDMFSKEFCFQNYSYAFPLK